LLLTKKNGHLERLLEQKQNEVQSQSDSLDSIKVDNETLRTKNDKLEVMLNERDCAEDETKKAQIDALSRDIVEKTTQLESLLLEKDELLKKNDELQTLLTKKEENFKVILDNKMDSLNQTIEDKDDQLTNFESQYKSLQEENSRLNTIVGRLNQLESEHQELTDRNVELAKQSDLYQENLLVREKEIEVLNESIEETAGGLVKIKDENLRLLSDVQALEANIGKRSEEMTLKQAEMVESNQAKENLLAHYQDENQALKCVVEEKEMSLQSKEEYHQQQLAKYKDSLENLHQIVQKHQVECQQLSSTLEQKEHSHNKEIDGLKEGQ